MDPKTFLMILVISSAVGLVIGFTFQVVIHSVMWRHDFEVWPWKDNWLKHSIKGDLRNLKMNLETIFRKDQERN